MRPYRPFLPPSLAFFAGATLALLVARAAGLELELHLIPGGGGTSQAGNLRIDGSIGQPVAESEASWSGVRGLRSGFWAQFLRWLNLPTVTREDVVERRPGEGAHVLIRALLENDSAAEREPIEFIEAAVVSRLGGSIQREGPWLIYEPLPSMPPDAEDSFEYTIRDALGLRVTGQVRVRIATTPGGGPPNALEVEIIDGPPSLVRVRFQGISGRTYQVQTAPDLPGPWTNADALVAGTDGSMIYIEPLATGPRFYRIVESVAP